LAGVVFCFGRVVCFWFVCWCVWLCVLWWWGVYVCCGCVCVVWGGGGGCVVLVWGGVVGGLHTNDHYTCTLQDLSCTQTCLALCTHSLFVGFTPPLQIIMALFYRGLFSCLYFLDH